MTHAGKSFSGRLHQIQAALLSKCITKSEIVCYEDLGAEAIRKIEIRDFPVIVVIDSQGNNLYETAIKEFAAI